jgi:hypothetical protein
LRNSPHPRPLSLWERGGRVGADLRVCPTLGIHICAHFLPLGEGWGEGRFCSGGSAININIPVVAFLFIVTALLACAPGSGGLSGMGAASPSPVTGERGDGEEIPPSPSLQRGEDGSASAEIRGRVTLPGGSNVQDVTIEVTQVPEAVTAEVVAEGLEVPWELVFTPDGRILVTDAQGASGLFRMGRFGKSLLPPWSRWSASLNRA